MTTKVKAQKFRVRRAPRAASASAAPEAGADAPLPRGENGPRQERPAAPDPDRLFDNDAGADGFGDAPFPGSAAAEGAEDSAAPEQDTAPRRRGRGAVAKTLDAPETEEAKTGDVTPADETGIDAEIDEIRREGLTGRQLRMARRVAKKHGIAATSDFDAVRLLRKQGIDPFQRAAMLELVSTEGAPQSRALTTTPGPALPKTVDPAPKLPSPDILDRLSRDSEISAIQQDIARRRRRKMLLLVARLAVFVGIPTLLAGIYFYTIASPMYATKSAFVIQQAEAPSMGGGGLGGLLSGTSFATSQDSIAVQDFLNSRDAMLRLDADAGFKAHFSSEAIDAIQRLPENPTNEQAYKVYRNKISIGYDPTEGLLRMEVIAADPETSQRFSELLIDYAEEQVDHLTQRLREDQMKGARDSLDDAEQKMTDAQERVVALQEQLGIISPDAETASIMGQVSSFETQLQQKRLELQQLLDNPRPNQARVDGAQGDIRRLEALIANLRSQLTQAQGSSNSLARVSAELRMAEVDLATRQAMAQQAIQSLEAARIEANRQVRYLSLSSRPVAPDEPTYPRKFENTMLSLLIFAGIYLMASLTAAVLREQVSS
ncbi:capsule biosynthesis protein [Celeribacter indicus]|uniref:Capsule polysaccharide export n=1 Tax=Celeribacter indicus TaxID=1208324 RepID=A0A0B5E4Z1_9RHOB|nr:capsule biosynthesis protein [Celeribacter indicus]AJE48420.1 capsule polysaccharide export [Celeribacter indicus]SDX29760.1 capsular polysaccharide transport system permease protein [Celeribacter indicus]